jgi:hypothetical protein
MTDEEFKRKLSEVAEWGLPTVEQALKNRGLTRSNKPRRPKVKEITDEDIDLEDESSLIKDGANITYAPMIAKVKCQPLDCPDCRRHCPEGRKIDMQIYFKKGKKYVREKCLVCNKTKDPYTNQFNLTGSASSNTWHTFMKVDSGKRYQLKSESKKVIEIEQGRTVEVTESDEEIIKKYLD